MASVLRCEGASEEVIDMAKRPQRLYTSHLYNYQWEQFVSCRGKSLNPLTASEVELAQYLLSLFKQGNVPATVKVHRAAICSVFKHTNPGLASSVLLKDLISRLELERPRDKRVYPKFDIDLVLWQLLLLPFMDNSNSDLKIPLQTLAFKTAFLLA